jgi:hypothetical protein
MTVQHGSPNGRRPRTIFRYLLSAFKVDPVSRVLSIWFEAQRWRLNLRSQLVDMCLGSICACALWVISDGRPRAWLKTGWFSRGNDDHTRTRSREWRGVVSLCLKIWCVGFVLLSLFLFAGSKTTCRSTVHRPAVHELFCDTGTKYQTTISEYSVRQWQKTMSDLGIPLLLYRQRISRPLTLGLRAIFDLPEIPVKSSHRNATAQRLSVVRRKRGFTPTVNDRVLPRGWRGRRSVGAALAILRCLVHMRLLPCTSHVVYCTLHFILYLRYYKL